MLGDGPVLAVTESTCHGFGRQSQKNQPEYDRPD
jgi:hypothetical protein